MTQNGWIAVVVAVVVIGGGVWWFTSQQTPAAAPVPDTTTVGTGTQTPTPNPAVPVNTGASAKVSYNGSSFSPSTVTIARGGTVSFTSTKGNMWVASNSHPDHNGYDGTSRSAHCVPGYNGTTPFDQCSGGQSYSYTFQKAGTWGYHDHLNPTAGGSVIVK